MKGILQKIKVSLKNIKPNTLDLELIGPKNAVQSFNSHCSSNPYDFAKGEWDNRIGSNVINARNWRIAAFFATGLCFFTLFIVYAQSKKPPIKPILIEVEQETGRIAKVVNLNQITFNPSEALKRHFLFEWIKNVRNLPKDIVLLNNQLRKLYYFVTPNGKEKLNLLISDDHPFLKYQNGQTAAIEFISMNLITKASYQIQWQETFFQDSKIINRSKWTAILTINQSVPKDETTLMENPAGIWIDDFSFSKIENLGENK